MLAETSQKIKKVAIAKINVFLKKSDNRNFILAIWLRALNSETYLANVSWTATKGAEMTVKIEIKERNAENSEAERAWATSG